jgi:hypothetical protein
MYCSYFGNRHKAWPTASAGHAVVAGAAVRLCIAALPFLTASATVETFSPAPLPADEQQELVLPAEQPDIHLQPTFFPSPTPNFSGGFLPGSRSEDADEEDTQPTPGAILAFRCPKFSRCECRSDAIAPPATPEL